MVSIHCLLVYGHSSYVLDTLEINLDCNCKELDSFELVHGINFILNAR